MRMSTILKRRPKPKQWKQKIVIIINKTTKIKKKPFKKKKNGWL